MNASITPIVGKTYKIYDFIVSDRYLGITDKQREQYGLILFIAVNKALVLGASKESHWKSEINKIRRFTGEFQDWLKDGTITPID